MSEKTCRICQIIKAASEFPRGSAKCRRCLANELLLRTSPYREAYIANGLPGAGVDLRGQTPLGQRNWVKGPRKENDTRARKRRWTEANPEKRAAHQAVEYALRKGRMERRSCERCGAQKAQAHHDDYSKQLDVTWLCPSHHRERHRELRGETTATRAGLVGGR